ncbi:MAG TPA: H-X9-DG-CTERM domain-containing protein, partial [Gemmataceae bacterium]|nr:H-X9-DG-CTERM domain-containing protein [Gemmataceae bacterium]
TGKDTAFEGKDGVKISEISAGLSRTIIVAEAGKAVPWTKPEDMSYDAAKPLPKLGGLFKHGFHILMADGAVRFIGRKFNEKGMHALIQRNSMELVDLEDLNK